MKSVTVNSEKFLKYIFNLLNDFNITGKLHINIQIQNDLSVIRNEIFKTTFMRRIASGNILYCKVKQRSWYSLHHFIRVNEQIKLN